MDNLTHTLFGLTLARTPLARAGRGTTAALVLASNVPDIDIVAAIRGTDSYLRWHRGPTHGPLGIIAFGLLVAAIVRLGVPLLDRSPDEEAVAAWPMLAVVSMIGVLCHVLMDFPTSYGNRIFSPFDWHWFAVDWMPIIDVYLLTALGAGLLFGNVSAAARRRNAAIVLALMAANYGVRGMAHRQALAAAPRIFGPLLPARCDTALTHGGVIDYWPRAASLRPPATGKRCLVELAAIPTFFSPFKWRVIAQLSNAYEMHDVDLLDSRLRQTPDSSEAMWRVTLRVPNVWTPPVWTAASTPLARTFLGFARFPAARSFVDPTGTATVRWNDMRFIGARLALSPTQNDPFAVVVRIAPDGHVLDQRLGR
jgi:inner membrane protein